MARSPRLRASAFALALLATPAAAQPSRDECSARLARAQEQYQAQQFAEVERLMASCMDRLNLPATEMDEGFRLLTLAFLRENLLADAQATVIKHLAWSFTYEPDEIRDPPLYVALVRVTRAQLTVPPGALVASAAPTRAPATTQATAPPDALPASPTGESGTAEPALADEPATETVSPTRDTETGSTSEMTFSAADTPATSEMTQSAADAARREGEAHVPPPPPDSRLLRAPPDVVPAPVEDDGVGFDEPTVTEATSARYAGGLEAVPGTTPAGVGLLGADPATIMEPLEFATVMPEIVGGRAAIRLEYPEFERRAGIEGRVVVRFVVGRDGTVSDAEVLRGVGPGLDAAAMEALHRLRFTPGRQNGEPVPVRTTLTFEFRAPGR